jgi:predicted nuclease of predicted toxin-antitoxin system
VKLLLDMNLSPRWAELLRQAGHDAVHWSTVGQATAEDQALMAWARTHGYVVVTNDLDFGAILAATQAEGPSVLQMRTEAVSPHSLGDRLLKALERFEGDLLAGALITVDERRERARLLPIKPQRPEPTN